MQPQSSLLNVRVGGLYFTPRARDEQSGAVAERAWSTKETTDKVDAQARIHELRCRLLDRGINAEPIGQCTDIGGGCTGTGPQFFPGKAGFCPREWVPV